MKKKSLAWQITLFLIILIIIRIIFNYVLFNKKIDLFEIIFVVIIIALVCIYFNYYEKHIKEASQSVVTQHPALYLIFMIVLFSIITTLGLIFIAISKGDIIYLVLIAICSFLILIDILLYSLMKQKMKNNHFHINIS